MDNYEDATEILKRLGEGHRDAVDRLLPLVYGELRALAGKYMRRERSDHTLQPTALVHEAYVRLIDQSRVEWQNRKHFFATAAQAMRRILVDHARGRASQRRGGDRQRVPLQSADGTDAEPTSTLDILSLDEALSALEQSAARKARIVELRFFGGLGFAEIAEILGVTERTVYRDWRYAQAWLYDRLRDGFSTEA